MVPTGSFGDGISTRRRFESVSTQTMSEVCKLLCRCGTHIYTTHSPNWICHHHACSTQPFNSETFLPKSQLAKQLLKFCTNIADAMAYLSGRGFIHRDLAARNILLDEHMQCKVGENGHGSTDIIIIIKINYIHSSYTVSKCNKVIATSESILYYIRPQIINLIHMYLLLVIKCCAH